MEKFIMANGCALRVKMEGDGETTMVLLHGYLESLDVWDEFVELLVPPLKVVRLDLPGHGISEVKGEIHTMEFIADTVHAALLDLGVKKCVMGGHSMGGYAVLEFLRKYPQMLSGVVLLNSKPDADTEANKKGREREIEVILSGKKDMLVQSIGKRFAKENREVMADTIEGLQELVVLTEDEGAVALVRGMEHRKDMNETMRESKVPQMMMFGKKDEFITPEIALEIIQRQPQAKVVWLENSGHMGFIEEPDKSAGTVLEFCEQVSN